jgi:hypothetical protein
MFSALVEIVKIDTLLSSKKIMIKRISGALFMLGFIGCMGVAHAQFADTLWWIPAVIGTFTAIAIEVGERYSY